MPAGLVAAAVLAPAFAGYLTLSPASPLTTRDVPSVTEAHRSAVLDALALVPGNAPVSAQSGLAARLSQREQVYEFPRGSDEVAWVIVDQRGFRTTQSVAAGYERALEEARATRPLLYDRDGVLVFGARTR
jgi:hypothetical protein